MTTVAYRDGVLAGDGRVTIGDMVVTNKQRKVHRLSGGRLFGWSGSLEDGERLLMSIKADEALPSLGNITALMIHPDGAIELFEGALWVRRPMPYYALGSGSPYAIGAMDAGATAVEAVRIGIKRDTGSGGSVVSVKMKEAQ